VTKRVLLYLGLFLAGVLIGFEIAWLLGIAKGNTGTAATVAPREEITISLAATIDGTDRFIFTPDDVRNEHREWRAPSKVLFNGEPWDDLSHALSGWTDLAKDLDLPAAKLATREGRGIIVLEPTAEGFDLVFADTQLGAGQYAVTISIPRR
jgi:hypothetical protein